MKRAQSVQRGIVHRGVLGAALAAAIWVTLWAPKRDRLSAEPLPNQNVHFAVRPLNGPNDGEPLSLARFQIETDYDQNGHVLVYRDSVFLTSLSFQSSHGRIQSFFYEFDSRPFGNSHLSLRFYLMSEDYQHFLAYRVWQRPVATPEIHLPEQLAPLTPVTIKGRHGDVEYRLLGGSARDRLKQAPVDGEIPPLTQLIAFGAWAPAQSGAERPSRQIVVKLDILFKIHGLDAELILWTRHPESGWASSPVASLRSPLPKPQVAEISPIQRGDYNTVFGPH
jgi:hypothetical protein